MSERISPFSKYNEGEGTVASCFQQYGVRIDIPQRFLWGRQTMGEYSRRKLKYVRDALATGGKTFLDDHPIAVVFVPSDVGSFLTVYDGHHRARKAPAFGIYQIPSEVVDLDQFADSLDRNPTELKEVFNRQRLDAYSSFWQKAKIFEAPRYVDAHIRTLGELSRYFQGLALPELITRSLPYNPGMVRTVLGIAAMQAL